MFLSRRPDKSSGISVSESTHSPTVFQLKAMLFSAWILTPRGAEPSNLHSPSDVWALRESV
jgi:hypothetical protein